MRAYTAKNELVKHVIMSCRVIPLRSRVIRHHIGVSTFFTCTGISTAYGINRKAKTKKIRGFQSLSNLNFQLIRFKSYFYNNINKTHKWTLFHILRVLLYNIFNDFISYISYYIVWLH